MTGMDDACRCPHPDHSGVCGQAARLNCPTCKVALCLDCAANHHPRDTQHRAGKLTDAIEEARNAACEA